ncbi:hypothetical protein BGW36DRAFT_362334 [Talaromyces proteolyticus]|uniref:J domain-containing protein n=1 Tax=Talaromyces proteolyticus TaxID=1131652 RepID=A0AAD4KI51_9EURO|nr:uncharacterized protein BGW36DRAFT_362334 [Talaromyces proteolyticus]KAH8692783.1 hypothetical protein BGW36DRAFT_362334 [Talaromyces proteolyticus]
MSSELPDFDPYTVLGVSKSSNSAEIKTAYRKLILKCHPDKVADVSLRPQAADNFQKVQQSYEILSDDTRREMHDNLVRLEALRSAANAMNASKSMSSREYRDGRMYEERAPADAAFFTDSDDRFAEEPPSYSQKYSQSSKRAHTKVGEEKKAKSVPVSSSRTTKQSDRDHAKSRHHDRAKDRTKERRRDGYDKYERTTASYTYANDHSESEDELVYVKVSSHSRSSPRDSVPRRSKTEPVTTGRSRGHYVESDSGSDTEYEHRRDNLDRNEDYWREYTGKGRGHHPTRPHAEYDSHRYDRESSNYSSRSYRNEDRALSPLRTSRRSHDRLSSQTRGLERSATSTTSPPKLSSSRAPPPVARAATAPYPRTRREGSSRSESNGMSKLVNMVAGISMDGPNVSTKTRPRGAERYDSGYSSGPGTPEMSQGTSGVPKSSRYHIVESPDRYTETIVREPAEVRNSPSRSSTSSRTPKTRTYTYDSREREPEVLLARPAASRSSSHQQFTDVRYAPEISIGGRRFARQTVY